MTKGRRRAYYGVFVLPVPDVRRHASHDSVAQVPGSRTIHPVHPIHAPDVKSECQVRGQGRSEGTLTLDGGDGSPSDVRLGRSCLLNLNSSSLRPGEVIALTLAIVDALPCPRRFCRGCSQPTFVEM